jgi:hypothetical protein
MAWVFVQGMVRWHNRNDLLKRFPEGWPEYKNNVPEWIPRWKPWVPSSARFSINSVDAVWPTTLNDATGLEVDIRDGIPSYRPAGETRPFFGLEARLFALTHINFAWALVAHAALIVVLAGKYVLRQAHQSTKAQA